MNRIGVRRSRAATFTTAAAMAAVFAVPAAASATVTTTNVTSPAPDSVFDSKNAYLFGSPYDDDKTVRVTGVAPGAADGDEVSIVCTITGNGAIGYYPLTYDPVVIEDGKFSADVHTPPYTCRIRAVPYDGLDVDELDETSIAPFAGPRALGGGFAVLDYDELGSAPGSDFNGVESYFSTRGQRNGIVFTFGAGSYLGGGALPAGSGGLYITALVEDTYYRFLFGPSALLGGYGGLLGGPDTGLLADAGLVVDDKPAAVAPFAGTEKAKVLSRTLNPTNGDQVVVESAPVAFPVEDPGPGESPFTFTGITLERTTSQDKDGQQVRISDVFRSADGAAHRVEARYGESIYQDFYSGDEEDPTLVEPASFRIPWQTGDEYVVPEAGRTFGPAPAGPATIWIHGPRQDFSRASTPTRAGKGSAGATKATAARGTRAAARADDGGLPRRAEGALTFDSAPTDGKFLSRGSLVVRFVRDVPAGGTAGVSSTYSQDLTPEGLKDLVDGPAAPVPDPPAPLPATTPLPSQPVIVPRLPGVPGTPNPLPKVARSTGRVLLTKEQGRRLRDRKPVTVTTKGVPAGRYGITIRRWVKDGRTIADGVKTIKKDGDLKVKLRLTKYGRWYLGLKRTRDRKSVKVRVIVTWTPPGKGRLKQKTSYVTNFR